MKRKRRIFDAGKGLSMSNISRTNRRIGRNHGHRMHRVYFPGPGKYRGRRIALRAEDPVSAAVCVVLTNVVFAGK